LGIYLPMLVVEPLLIYRFGRVQETMQKAVSKGLRITLGYVLQDDSPITVDVTAFLSTDQDTKVTHTFTLQ